MHACVSQCIIVSRRNWHMRLASLLSTVPVNDRQSFKGDRATRRHERRFKEGRAVAPRGRGRSGSGSKEGPDIRGFAKSPFPSAWVEQL